MQKLIEELQLELNHKQILRPGMLNESSLARLITRISNKEGDIISDFGILTSFRGENNLETNHKRNRELISKLNEYKLGPYYLSGHWVETIEGKSVDVVEDSLLVVKTPEIDRESFISLITSLGNYYQQEAVLIGLQGKGIFNYTYEGTSKKIGDKLILNKMEEAYSVMKKKPIPFVFEGIQKPYGFMSSLAFNSLGIKYL